MSTTLFTVQQEFKHSFRMDFLTASCRLAAGALFCVTIIGIPVGIRFILSAIQTVSFDKESLRIHPFGKTLRRADITQWAQSYRRSLFTDPAKIVAAPRKISLMRYVIEDRLGNRVVLHMANYGWRLSDVVQEFLKGVPTSSGQD